MDEKRDIELYEIKLALNYLRRETATLKLPMVSHMLSAAMEALENDHGPIRTPDAFLEGTQPQAHNDC
ncbi:MAG: hypothetical protein KAI28_00585 [Sphingomonadales bacterium]|nr:hypothetical protein [Sphingomonadales bacterium]